MKEILNLEASKKAMAQFNEEEKALLLMDMTHNLLEAHKMRHDAEVKLETIYKELTELRAFKKEAIEVISGLEKRHEWQPTMGPCVCEWHTRSRELLGKHNKGE